MANLLSAEAICGFEMAWVMRFDHIIDEPTTYDEPTR